MRIALKVDVDTLTGAREGVPALLKVFDEYKLQASFFFSLGPDNSGRLLRNGFRPRGVTAHYPGITKLYGTLLPAPLIGKRQGELIRSVKAAGHEVGIRAFDAVGWQLRAAHADERWTRQALARAVQAYGELFGEGPRAHAAAGWQLNPHLLALEGEYGFDYASDTRGKTAYLPELQQILGEVPQIPVTLPTLDEALQDEGATPDKVNDFIFFASQKPLPHGQVYNLRAEVEGRAALGLMEKLLVMWKGSQRDFHTLGELKRMALDNPLVTHRVGWGQVPGRDDHLAMQSTPLNEDSQ